MNIYNKITIWISVVAVVVLCFGLVVPESAQKSESFEGVAENEIQPLKININTATVKEFTYCDGISETTAKNIIEYREKHGDFRKTVHITKVPGIGKEWFKEWEHILCIE